MSKYEDEHAQPREKERVSTPGATDWKIPHGQVKAQRDSGDVSPRSRSQNSLSERHTEEIRRRIEEAKERAAKSSPVSDTPVCSQSPTQSAAAAPTNSKLSPSSSTSVSPELLKELREIIREEFVQLNKGEGQADPGERLPRSSRPSSPIRPWTNAQASSLPDTASAAAAATFADGLSKDSNEKKIYQMAREQPPDATQNRAPPRQPTVRFSNETKAAVPVPTASRSGVDNTRRATTTTDATQLTAIDQKWGVLFDKDGEPTKRLEHVVRELAKYIIDEFMPQNSIIITPEKMALFYSLHRLDKEVFPFAVLFKSRSNHFNEALEGLYRDLGCEYFLAPPDNKLRPSIPGLTPAGFNHWLVSFIQAYPEEEAKRMDKVVSALPIEADSLLDGKPERLPKRISRYLLPETPLRKVQRIVDEAMRDFTQDINNSSTSQSNNAGRDGGCGRPTPIVATQEKRPSMATSGAQSSRYVPDNPTKESKVEEAGTGQDKDGRRANLATAGNNRDHDDSRRKPTAPPPGSGSLGRTNSLESGGRSAPSSRAPHASSSSSRKNRSPQRNNHSQSVPRSLSRDDLGSDRARGAGNISAAAANVAAAVLRPSSRAAAAAQLASHGMSSSTPALDTSARDPRAASGGGADLRDRRPSVDGPVPRAPTSAFSLRDKAGLENSSSSSSSSSSSGKQSKRRSMVLPDLKGPTWDDYLKSSAPKASTSSFVRRAADPGYHSSG